MNFLELVRSPQKRAVIASVPEGYDAKLAALLAAAGERVLHVARDEAHALAFAEAAGWFAPGLHVCVFPAWDCVPYDRVSPRGDIMARRLSALAELGGSAAQAKSLLVVTTVNALLQRVPQRALLKALARTLKPGSVEPMDRLIPHLERIGYTRAATVVEPGDYAVRGGILDLFPPGQDAPLRLDYFGDAIERIRAFDPETQKSRGEIRSATLLPVSEIVLDAETIRRFRAGYVAAFGAITDGDPLYEAVSAGRKHAGMEHFLPLFAEGLETLLDHVTPTLITLDPQAPESVDARFSQIREHFDARMQNLEMGRSGKSKSSLAGPSFKPLSPKSLYLASEELNDLLNARRVRELTPFARDTSLNAPARAGRDFAPERQQPGRNVFDAVISHAGELRKAGKQPIFACWSEGSAERMGTVLADHGAKVVKVVKSLEEARALHRDAIAVCVLGLERGFETEDTAFISEQDVLGDRLIRTARKTRKAANFLKEATALTAGDLVVHVEHGIGRYAGLVTIEVQGAPHDCLKLEYDGGRLFLPVENIELLTRFGSEEGNVQLDRLGGAGWQARKAKLKNRIREIAAELMRVAAERALKRAPEIVGERTLFEEFCARFPYEETEDQQRAIAETLEDLAAGKPMDRLVCGDVGFGKTEVALRAAFMTALTGKQVAVVVPTTLLARQHFRTFSERFNGWPMKVRQLSRLVSAKEASDTRKALAEGQVDIVVGTHALLAKSIAFKDLGLLVIDEEQHFGVAHKERLKQLRADVHVLTLTATPIPRTLQLALSGVRDMSLIATPPVDRLAVRTFVGPLDPLVVREALLREHYRGGQSFYIVPRIADLAEAREFIEATVPEVKVITAHGQLAPGQLDDVMNAFYERKFEVLLSTTIVESGLDIPTANTMIIHRADMFGLAQLYQLRGRIGRSKARAYAYLTLPPGKTLTANAERRLRVLQTLDTLGAGFSLASHDLDIRGAGNLLGEEQTGHIKEVGLELYQEMLEEAVAALREGGGAAEIADQWSPQINLGASVLIPETYVADLGLRLSLYRRLAELENGGDIDGVAAEMIDRFGPLPDEVKQLLSVVGIKMLCRNARIERVEAGPKGATISFRKNEFPNAAELIALISRNADTMKVRPDQKILITRTWPDVRDRLEGTRRIVAQLAELAAG